MMNYQVYQELGGRLPEEKFNKLLPKALSLLRAFALDNCPYWSMQDFNIDSEAYHSAIVAELELLDEVGDSFTEKNPLNLTSVTTSGFTLNYGNQGSYQLYQGLPFSSVARSELLFALRSEGRMKRGVL